MIYSTSNTGSSGPQLFIEAGADFQSYTGSTYGSATSGIVDIGGCYVSENLASTGSSTGKSTSGLEQRATITVSSPNAGFSPVTWRLQGAFLPGFYASVDSDERRLDATHRLPDAVGRSIPIHRNRRNGRRRFLDVGQFPHSAPYVDRIRRRAATVVTRSAGPAHHLERRFAGHVRDDHQEVHRQGSASGSFTCLAPVAAGSFTVPSYVLGALPASTSTAV